MKAIVLLVMAWLLSVAAICQVVTEKKVSEKIDSIYAQLDPNDPEFEQKAAKGFKALANKLNAAAIERDSTLVEGKEKGDMVRDAIMQLLKEESDSSFSTDFMQSLPVVVIDLSRRDERFNLDNISAYLNLQVLVVTGKTTDAVINLDALFADLASLQIRELYIVNCGIAITSVPETIGSLSHLKKLALYGNSISVLPEGITTLVKLEELYVDANPVSFLPADLAKLKKLKVLGIANTNISKNEIVAFASSLPACKILAE